MTDSRLAALGVQVLVERDAPSSRLAALGVQVLHTVPVPGIAVDLDLATETDAAQSLTGVRGLDVALASETSAALDLVHALSVGLTLAEETDEALDIRPTGVYPIDLAEEVDSAFDVAAGHSVSVDIAAEVDEAFRFLSTPAPVRLVNTSVGNFHDLPRPRRHREGTHWVGLWPRLVHPATQKGLLLWQDGTVKEVTDWPGQIGDAADDYIAGGTVWIGMDNSWQAEVLAAAGYTLVRLDEED